MPRSTVSLIALSVAALISGCSSTFPRPFRDAPDSTSTEQAVDLPSRQFAPGNDDGVIDLSTEGTISPEAFLVRTRESRLSDPLPTTARRTVSVTESGLYDALQMLVHGTGISLHVEGGARALERSGPVAVVALSGNLDSVLRRLSDRMGFFWSYRDSVLTIEPSRQFVVDLPAALSEDSLAGLTNTIQSLGAVDTYLDRMSRTLSFRANRKQFDVIDDFLRGIRSTGSMLVYRLQIYEVDLNDASSAGVAWNKLASSNFNRYKDFSAATTGAGSVAGSTAGGATAAAPTLPQGSTLDGAINAAGGFGAMFVGRRFSLDFLVEFLKTQGTVRAVSQPRITMMNRGRSTMRVGETRMIISKIGSSLANGISQITTETTNIRTGLDMSLSGEETGGTIITRARLELNNLVEVESRPVGTSVLELPRTSDNEFSTTLRLPPGYTAVLGGISKDRVSRNRAVGMSKNMQEDSVTRTELVIVMTSNVVRFTPSAQAKEGNAS